MRDNGAKLARMANDIATFFRSYSHDEAVAGVRDHIRDFWAPVMRGDLASHATSHPSDLDPLVVEALNNFATAASPTERATAGPAEAGEIGASDAG